MKKINLFLNILIAGLVLVFAGFFVYKHSQNSETETVQNRQLSDREVDLVVNKHLAEASVEALKQKMETDKALAEVKRQMKEQERQKALKQAKENESIPAEQQIWKESKEPAVSEATSERLKALKKKEDERLALEAYKKEYIENARKGGFEIELSEDGQKVIKSTPIRQPSQDSDSVETYPSE